MSATVSVTVALRCRPMNSKETAMGSQCIVVMDDKLTTISDPTGTAEPKEFTFDFCYFLETTQQQVYEDLGAPLVAKAMDGYNGTIFAYGQTGSGKSYSMMGYGEDYGIIPLMNQDIFRQIDANTSEDTKFLVTVSYLEIYNEVVKDLLNPSDRTLKIREHPELGIYVDSLAELVVTSADEVTNLIEQGGKVRKVAETQMNARSSRSHSCFTIKINKKTQETVGDVVKETALNAKINLVDLAGSERAAKTGATGNRLKEGAAINKSLSALGNVINALSSGKGGHIPYRDSKLTRLLQESLGGNALTVMVATLSPADYNYDETLGTLKYAQRAKRIKNETKKNEDVNEKIIRELREEIDELKARLSAMAAGGGGGSGGEAAGAGDGSGDPEQDERSREEMERMKEMISNLEREQNSSWEEKQRLSRLFEEERAKNLASENKIRSVMQTMKEENVESMKRLRKLQKEKTALTRAFKKEKEGYNALKKGLEADMASYQQLMESADDSGASDDALQALLERIEQKRRELLSARETMSSTKKRLSRNEQAQTEERAELAAQKALLREDATLRGQIQEEERKKLLAEKGEFLQSALAEERGRLRDMAADQMGRMRRHFRSVVAHQHTDSEQELLVLRVQDRADKALLLLEIDRMQADHDSQIAHMQAQHTRELRLLRRQHKHMMSEMAAAFEEETRRGDKEKVKLMRLLAQAANDVRSLSEQNETLTKQLQEQLLWEPPTH